jgi:hypothetical protein
MKDLAKAMLKGTGLERSKHSDHFDIFVKYGYGNASLLTSVLWILNVMTYMFWIWMLQVMPVVAAKTEQPFPDIPFQTFCQFIEKNFNSGISLSTVLMILFSLTENTTLLSLHARQQSPMCRGEISSITTGWMKCLSRSILQRVANKEGILSVDEVHDDDKEQTVTKISLMLYSFAKLLKLHPFNRKGKFTGKLKPVSHDDISPVHVICPDSVVCETLSCNPRALLQNTKPRDIPLVTLIKNFVCYEQVPVLSGLCPDCKTVYYADHERAPARVDNKYDRLYLNSAVYIKVGQSLWVDRLFTSAVMSGIYNFHASPTTYAQFWNVLYDSVKKVGRRHIWQAFVQESLRMQAAESKENFIIEDGLPIDDVTREAFTCLGNNGVITGAMQHVCNECTQKYREQSATNTAATDPSAVVGMEDTAIEPVFQSNIVENCAPVKMVVMDGIVMGHTVSLINCARIWTYIHFHFSIVGTQTVLLTC